MTQPLYGSAEVKNKSKLRSKISSQPVYNRYVNLTNHCVRIYWIDYDGKKRLYKKIITRETFGVNTFVTHPWIFENDQNGDRLMGNYTFVYYSTVINPRVQESGDLPASRLNYRLLPITSPLYSLRTRALQVIRNLISNVEDVGQLDIPKCLKEDLTFMIRKKNCSSKHEVNCSLCFNVSEYLY